MEVLFSAKFAKDLKKIKSQESINKVDTTIDNVEKASKISDIHNIKKLKGHENAYRIRIGDFRIGLFISGNIAEFAQIKKRADIYKYFPFLLKLLLKI
jgi:mRNA interferase RelE/StbE